MIGMAIHYRRLLHIRNENPVKKIALRKSWHATVKMFSYGDYLVLINFIISSLSMFVLSFFEISKEARKKD
jgi:hypothetical protein